MSNQMIVAGVALIAFGAFMLGYSIGRRRVDASP
jgi:hypothetical protein